MGLVNLISTSANIQTITKSPEENITPELVAHLNNLFASHIVLLTNLFGGGFTDPFDNILVPADELIVILEIGLDELLNESVVDNILDLINSLIPCLESKNENELIQQLSTLSAELINFRDNELQNLIAQHESNIITMIRLIKDFMNEVEIVRDSQTIPAPTQEMFEEFNNLKAQVDQYESIFSEIEANVRSELIQEAMNKCSL